MRVLSRMLLAMCLLLAVGPGQALAMDADPSALEPLESVLIMPVDGIIVIDPQGQVAEFHMDKPMVPKHTSAVEQVHALLDRAVRQWRFEPVLIDGTPRRVSTKMRVVLAAHKVSDGYQIKIDNVVFPGEANPQMVRAEEIQPQITGKKLRPPLDPGGPLTDGVTGKVLLYLQVSADGRVEQVIAAQTLIYDASRSQSAWRKAIHAFERAAVSLAKDWTFNVPDGYAHLPAAYRTVAVPVQYSVRSQPDVDATGMWYPVVRVALRKPEWLQVTPNAQHIGVADVGEGEIIPANSSVKLITNVVGTMAM